MWTASGLKSRRVVGLALATPLAVAVAGSAIAHPPEKVGDPPGRDQSAPPTHSDAGGRWAPEVESRLKPVLKQGQRQFRDLNANGQIDVYEDWRKPVGTRVADLVDRMTLEEKAGLILISSFGDGTTPGAVEQNARYFIIRDDPEPFDLATRNNSMQELGEASRLGIPLVFVSNPRNHVNAERITGHAEAGGQLSDWPGEPGLAATNDPDLIEEFGRIAAREWRAVGIHKGYMYMADVATEPRWTRTSGTFGEDPHLAADMIGAVVRGFQGDELGSDSVSLTIKHFPGGGPRVEGTDPHWEWGQTNEYPTPGSLYEYHLPPFEAAIAEGAASIMPYYARPENDGTAAQLPPHLWVNPDQQFDEVGMTFSRQMITDILRGDLGFEGYVNSDSDAVGSENWGVQHLSIPEQYATALNAGTNAFSTSGRNLSPAAIVEAVRTGLVSERTLNDSVSYLLDEMMRLGLFEDPYVDPAAAQDIADSAASQAVADEAHRKSLVLLRNGGADERAESPLPISDEEESDVRLYVEVFRRTLQAEQTAQVRETVSDLWPEVELVDDPAEATHSLLWVVPALSFFSDDTEGDPPSVVLDLEDDTRIDAARIRAIQAQVDTNILAVNMSNPWLIDNIEADADAIVATFNSNTHSLIGLLRGHFGPTGTLPYGVPKNLEAVERNASDVPSYAETFDYVFEDAAGNAYEFGFGLGWQD